MFNGTLPLMCIAKAPCVRHTNDQREWIHLERLGCFLQRLIPTCHVSEEVGVPLMRTWITRVEFDGALKLFFGSKGIEVVMNNSPTQRGMCFCRLLNF